MCVYLKLLLESYCMPCLLLNLELCWIYIFQIVFMYSQNALRFSLVRAEWLQFLIEAFLHQPIWCSLPDNWKCLCDLNCKCCMNLFLRNFKINCGQRILIILQEALLLLRTQTLVFNISIWKIQIYLIEKLSNRWDLRSKLL